MAAEKRFRPHFVYRVVDSFLPSSLLNKTSKSAVRRYRIQASLFSIGLDTEISPPIEIYVEKLTCDEKEGPVFLDPFVFGAPPRLDILNRVVLWQRAKRRVVNK